MHPHKKSYLFLYYAFLFVFFGVYFGIMIYLSGMTKKGVSNAILVSFCLYGLGVGMDYKNRSRKYVKFYDTYVRINAYHKLGILKTYDINVVYEDIRAVRLKKSPVFGLPYIEIDADGFGSNIKLKRIYKNYRKMCETLYLKLLACAPNTKLDPKFIEYARRNNEN